MKTRFILIGTSHAGNVGAAARAIRTMGFDDLVLVAPRWPDVLGREETRARASGATDVLAKARVVAKLDEALAGITHLCATAMTPRDFGPPTRAPRAHFEMLLKQERDVEAGSGLSPVFSLESGAGVAFLFGPERYGLANEDVYRCHVCLRIPTDPGHGSLNLAAAVQVIAYEWRLALGGFAEWHTESAAHATHAKMADAQQVAALLAHWAEALVAIGFLDPAAPKKLLPRLNRLANRLQLTPAEVDILRGIARAALASAARADAGEGGARNKAGRAPDRARAKPGPTAKLPSNR
ncbi:MAG: tRNA (cytidine(32)/uridine(32)-2'-O)-methyltransferase [Burkholderiaceae bacterium]|jgi:tRNA/rRNA methyltransferase|nr:MAG: tRNA (cytidine(32)/uridine(32)-2'-O)-methyltransferase [Burkholderiaceae bacterium]